MQCFSKRAGFVEQDIIQNTYMSDRLFNRLLNYIVKKETPNFINIKDPSRITKVIDSLGLILSTGPDQDSIFDRNLLNLKRYLYANKNDWFIIYDTIEFYVNAFTDKKQKGTIQDEVNQILKEENSMYRLVNYQICPVKNEIEVSEINKAISEVDLPSTIHIEKALKLLSDRKNPDYENSIKESISAIESACRIITGIGHSKTTLGAALKKLETSNVYIHPAMVNAFNSLYGYTNTEEGIRHATIDFNKAKEEDARFMLVVCSAFLNYLHTKNLEIH